MTSLQLESDQEIMRAHSAVSPADHGGSTLHLRWPGPGPGRERLHSLRSVLQLNSFSDLGHSSGQEKQAAFEQSCCCPVEMANNLSSNIDGTWSALVIALDSKGAGPAQPALPAAALQARG